MWEEQNRTEGVALKAPLVKNANNLNENNIVTTFKSVDELNVKMIN